MFRRKKSKQAEHPPLSWSRRWLRRLVRLVVFLIVLVVVLRGVLWLGMPWFLERTFAAFDLDASYHSLRLSLLTGDLELWHLNIRPKGEEKVLTDLEYCKADVSLSTLLRGRLVIPRLEVDGLDVTIERQADGTLVGWQSLVRLATSGSKKEATPKQAQKPKKAVGSFKVKLQSPLRLDALRLQHVRVNFKDASVEPAVDTHLDLNMRLSDLGSLWRPTRFQLIVAVDGIVDQLSLEGTADGDADSLEGRFNGALQGAYPSPVEAYLHQIGVALWAKEIDAGFRGSFAVKLSEATDPNNQKPHQRVAIEAGLKGIQILADNVSEVSLGACGLQAEISEANGIHVESLDVSDGRLRFWRDPEGGISVAGVYLKKPSRLRGPKKPKNSSPKSPLPSSPSPQEVSNEGLTWSVGKVDLKAVELIWEEQRIAEVPPLHLHVDEGTIGPILAPQGGVLRTPMQGHLRLPGIINKATIDGHCDLISRNKYVDLVCDFHDVTPKNLGGYLSMAQLTSEHESAHLSGRVRWSLTRGIPGTASRNSAEIYDVKLVDKGKTLAALEHLIVKDIAKDKVKRRLSIDRVAVQGEQTTFRMDRQGNPHLWGFGIGTSKLKSAQPIAPVKTTENVEEVVVETPQAPVAPKQRSEFLLKELTWDVGDITLIDETEPNQEPDVRMASLHGAIENFVLNAHNAEELDDGRVDIQLTIPELIEELKIQGVVASDASDTVFDLAVDGKGLEFQEMAPYLKSVGLRPHLDTSSLHVDLDARLSPMPTTTLFSLNLADCRLEDANHSYFSLGGLAIDEFDLSMGRLIQFKRLDVNEPRLFMMRDPNGLPIIAGMSLLPKLPKVQSESTTYKVKKPAPGIDIARLGIRGAEFSFLDERLDPPVHAKLGFELDVKDVNTISWETPAIVSAHWRLPGVMEKASLDARVQHDPNRTEIKSQFHVDGLHPHLIARYLPEGSTPLVHKGKFILEADASIDRDPNGGKRLNALIQGLDYREVNEPTPWVHLDEVRLSMETLKEATRQIVIHNMQVSGIEARMEKGQDGRLHVLGFALGSDPNEEMETQTPPEIAVVKDVNTPAMENVVADVGPREIPKPLPDLTIHKMHLDVRRLAFQDFNNPAKPTVALEEFVLANTDTIHMLGDKAGTHPPAKIALRGRVNPWIDTIDVNMAVAPFATPSSLAVDVNVAGIEGTPLMTWLPQLADRIDASDLTDGGIRGQFEVSTTVARRRATEFDFRQPFGATMSAKQIRFTHGEDEIWNGLDEMHMEVTQIDLQRQRYHIRSLEVIQPQCQLIQEPNGLRFFKMLLKTSTEGEQDPNSVTVVAVEPEPAETPTVKPDLRVRLDQLLISGLDFRFEDLTVEPHTIVPLNGLDLDLRGLVYPVPAKASPVRFNTIMTAGRVPIRSMDGKVSERFLLQEISASGHVTPGQQPSGWVKAGIRGFEMRALRGVADKQGIQIRDGIMDVGVDMRIRPSRRANTTIRIALSDLSMRDSSDGTIQKVLLLPVSLDVAIYMLQGLDGTLRVNVPVTIDLENASVENLSSAVIGATAAVLGKAIAKSPVKLATGATQLITSTGRLLTGTSGDKEERKPVEFEPIEMIFEPGQVTLNNALQVQIDELAKQLRKNKHLRVTARHHFGIGDIMIAERLVNPKVDDNIELLSQLRHLQRQMTNQRTDLAAKTQAAFGAGDFIDGGRLSSELADLDGKLGLLETAIDNILEQSGPGSAHLVRRRTRQGALSLARSRLISVRDALYETNVKDIKNKLQITQPSFITPQDNQPGRVTLTLSSVR